MKAQNYVALFLFVILPFIGLAQTMQASQQSEEEKTVLLKKAPQTVIENEFQSANDYFIPLTITILHKDDGSGGTPDNDVLELFCEVIENYAQYDINLYIDTIRHINNSAWYNSDALGSISLLLDVENTVNIYFLGWNAAFPVCASYTAQYDVMAFYGNQCIQADMTTRFFGHKFGLRSTYFGFFDGDNCGVQVSGGEKVDGSNCDTAGDFICDTPPDYTASPWECDANGEGCTQIDPDGVEFKPDGTNFMSLSNCRSQFSPMQVDLMKSTIEATFENPTTPPSSQNLLEITDNVELLFPENDAPSVNPLNVTFSWEPVENATHYLIEINRVANFSPSFIVENTIVTTNEYSIDELALATYYWRVKPYNAGYLCAPYSETNSFTTLIIGIEEIDGLESFEIYPNPTIAGQSISIELQSDKYLEGILSLYNVHGQTVYSNAITMNGSNRYEIKTEDLPSGLYVANIDFSNVANIQKKVLIIGQ